MSVSVNLQEVFSSDSQSNLTQKINFNFNQLLTLGLGEPGLIGPIGPQGPIGPAGQIGPQGTRGAKVYSVITQEDPISNPALGANSEDGDIFINNKELYVKGVTVSGTWGEVIDFQALVTGQSLQDTYKVFQLGVGGGDSLSKHSKFLRTNGIDISNSGLATSHPMYYANGETINNTQLVLSNFDESKTWRIQTGSLVQNNNESDSVFDYSSIAKIYAYLPSSLTGWRHQFELGSVDEIGVSIGGSTQAYVLTPSEQNLKFRKYRVAATGLTGSLYNRADIDLAGPISSANSLNGEIILSVNKKTNSATQVVEMGLTTSQVLSDRLASQALNTDGLIVSRAGTQHLVLGFDDALTTRVNLKTSSNISTFAINHGIFTLDNGNMNISVTDPTKEVMLGSAIKVKNSRLSAGIPFPVTAALSSDANTLDDYEEGTWGASSKADLVYVFRTLNVSNGGFQSSIPLYYDVLSPYASGNNNIITDAYKRYTKIGNVVTVAMSVTLDLYYFQQQATTFDLELGGLSAFYTNETLQFETLHLKVPFTLRGDTVVNVQYLLHGNSNLGINNLYSVYVPPSSSTSLIEIDRLASDILVPAKTVDLGFTSSPMTPGTILFTISATFTYLSSQ
jgi:hypothetical protein